MLPAGMDVAFIEASDFVTWGTRASAPNAAVVAMAPNAPVPIAPIAPIAAVPALAPSVTARRNARARAKAKANARARADAPGTRPLMTEQWRADHPDEWYRISSTYPSECAVCMEEEVTWDGPMDSHIATRCVHLLCVDCWDVIAAADRRCPLCRDDLSEWMAWRARLVAVRSPFAFVRVRSPFVFVRVRLRACAVASSFVVRRRVCARGSPDIEERRWTAREWQSLA
jgi:hypothetical protein